METVEVKLFKEIFPTGGLVRTFVSDSGSQFMSALFQEICKILGIEDVETFIYACACACACACSILSLNMEYALILKSYHVEVF